MKYQVALTFLLVSLVLAQYKCPKFKCGLDGELTADELCAKRVVNGADILFQLRVCTNKLTQGCSFAFASNTSSCANNGPVQRTLLPGEPCQLAENCFSNICLNGTCVGFELGYSCRTDAECKTGTYCSGGGRCEALAGEGVVCSASRCMNHLACASGKCVKIGSLPVGNSSDNALACSSLFVAADTKGAYKCAVGPKLKGYSKNLIECNMGDMCQYDLSDGKSLATPCKCGVNGDGKSYCRPGEGDQTDDINAFFKVASAIYDPPCHIANPWFCDRRLKDSKDAFHPSFVSYKNLTTPEMYANNDQCVQWNLNKDYWVSYNIVHPIEHKNNTDGATTLSAGISVLLALLLIELFFLI